MPSRSTKAKKAVNRSIEINFSNLYEYKHLSYAWFVRYALALTTGILSDPFEGPISPEIVKNELNTINEKIEEIVGQRSKKSSDSKWKACPLSLTNDDIITSADFEDYAELNTQCFMGFEFREYIRIFSGRGAKVSDSVRALKAIAKLAKLGRALTFVGKAFLFLDIDFTLQRDVYNVVKDFIKFVNNNEEVNYMARLVGSAAIIIHVLHVKRLTNQLKSLLSSGIVMYEVSDSGASMIDLTDIARSIDSFRLASHIYGLYELIHELSNESSSKSSTKRSRSFKSTHLTTISDLLGLLNKVSEAVIEYVNLRSLFPIYEYARYAITMLEREEIKKELNERINRILDTLYMSEGLRYGQTWY